MTALVVLKNKYVVNYYTLNPYSIKMQDLLSIFVQSIVERLHVCVCLRKLEKKCLTILTVLIFIEAVDIRVFFLKKKERDKLEVCSSIIQYVLESCVHSSRCLMF